MSEKKSKEDEKEDELRALFNEVYGSQEFRTSRSRQHLFRYLWRHHRKPTAAENIWKDALGEKAHFESFGPSGNRVRDRCRDLRDALEDYARGVRDGLCFELPPAPLTEGYQLKWHQVHDPLGATHAFWEPHLSSSRDVYVVYPELLFFQDWPKHFTFRFFHLNDEDEGKAKDELKKQYPKMYRKGLVAAYPYVAAGDIEARDLITNWFDKNAMVKVQHAITRRMKDKTIAESSLILFRSAATNLLIRDILTHPRSQHLSLRLQAGGVTANGRRYSRVIVKGTPKPSHEEMQRLAPYKPVRVGSDFQLDFTPEEGVELAILCRVPNPHGGAAVTIFNTESGRVVYQMAELLTDELRFRKAVEEYNSAEALHGRSGWPVPMPTSFEILYAIHFGSISTDYRLASLEPLAWRI